jgi:hypothetical protein
MAFFDGRKRGRLFSFGDEKVEYALSPFDELSLFEALLVDFSEIGLCMLTSQKLAVDQEIIIKGGMSDKAAVVIWAEEYAGDIPGSEQDGVRYKVGLMFV